MESKIERANGNTTIGIQDIFEIERQRDKETVIYRDSEIQRKRDTETVRYRDSETQRQ